jgi:hypothetical protein
MACYNGGRAEYVDRAPNFLCWERVCMSVLLLYQCWVERLSNKNNLSIQIKAMGRGLVFSFCAHCIEYVDCQATWLG